MSDDRGAAAIFGGILGLAVAAIAERLLDMPAAVVAAGAAAIAAAALTGNCDQVEAWLQARFGWRK